jgi:hypothetical protein
MGPTGPTGATGSNYANNYLYIYKTDSQTLTATKNFDAITFDQTASLDGWDHKDGSAPITCNQTGLYLVTVRCELSINNTGNSSITPSVSIKALLGDTEIAGSQTYAEMNVSSRSRQTLPLTTSFLLNATSGQDLTLNFGSSQSGAQIYSDGVGTSTNTSASVTIVRIL